MMTAPGGGERAEAESHRRHARRRATRATSAAIAALAVTAALGGLLLGWATGSGGSQLEGDPLALTVPDDWDRVQPAPRLGYLPLRSALAAAPRGDPDRGALVAGMSDAQGPTLLPPALEGSRRPVTIGALEALHHRGLDGRGASALTIPTVEGVATILCLPGRASDADFEERCQEAASTVETGTRALPVGPDPAYARGLSQVVESLNDRLRRRERRLQAGQTREQLQAAADEVASAWNAAAGAIRRVSPGPANRPIHARLARALDAAGEASAWRTRAIRDGDGERTAAADAVLERAARSAQEALAALPALGYEVG